MLFGKQRYSYNNDAQVPSAVRMADDVNYFTLMVKK